MNTLSGFIISSSMNVSYTLVHPPMADLCILILQKRKKNDVLISINGTMIFNYHTFDITLGQRTYSFAKKGSKHDFEALKFYEKLISHSS
jgi:hypothetical protein